MDLLNVLIILEKEEEEKKKRFPGQYLNSLTPKACEDGVDGFSSAPVTWFIKLEVVLVIRSDVNRKKSSVFNPSQV